MKKALVLLFVISALLSCGKKEVKQETDDSKIAQEAIMVAEEIKIAYLKNDLAAIEYNSTKDGYREILGAIKSFDKAELAFTPKWVDIDRSSVSLKVAWDGLWVVKGQKTDERGTAVFMFEGRPLKLNRVLRANPFRQPE